MHLLRDEANIDLPGSGMRPFSVLVQRLEAILSTPSFERCIFDPRLESGVVREGGKVGRPQHVSPY